jgi:hypothetical protein
MPTTRHARSTMRPPAGPRFDHASNPKLPDWCVLPAARDGRAEAVLTFDDRLAREAKRLGYRSPAQVGGA